MAKKPDSRLRVYIVERHVQPNDSVYVESSIMLVTTNKNRAKQYADEMEAEIELDLDQYENYTVTKHYVEGVAQ